jgi:hypothetical protein
MEELKELWTLYQDLLWDLHIDDEHDDNTDHGKQMVLIQLFRFDCLLYLEHR